MWMTCNVAKTFLAGLVGAMLASAALAQAPRSSVDLPATPGVPEFRDPKTGQIWTPLNVGQGPIGKFVPADRAFDPLAQTERVEGVVVQRPQLTPLGSVPITAGPTVPLVTIDDATLRAVPARRWQVVLYINNNSARTLVPMIDCRFTNGGKLVEDTRVLVPAVGPGVRGGMTIYGPKTDLFVDRALCRIVSP
jgi:hypothetical protein